MLCLLRFAVAMLRRCTVMTVQSDYSELSKLKKEQEPMALRTVHLQPCACVVVPF